MNNKKTYFIPVEISNTQYIKVSAITESEAINLVEESIHNNNLRQINDVVKIIREDIACEEDDAMIDNLIKDFNLPEDEMIHSIKGGNHNA